MVLIIDDEVPGTSASARRKSVICNTSTGNPVSWENDVGLNHNSNELNGNGVDIRGQQESALAGAVDNVIEQRNETDMNGHIYECNNNLELKSPKKKCSTINAGHGDLICEPVPQQASGLKDVALYRPIPNSPESKYRLLQFCEIVLQFASYPGSWGPMNQEAAASVDVDVVNGETGETSPRTQEQPRKKRKYRRRAPHTKPIILNTIDTTPKDLEEACNSTVTSKNSIKPLPDGSTPKKVARRRRGANKTPRTRGVCNKKQPRAKTTIIIKGQATTTTTPESLVEENNFNEYNNENYCDLTPKLKGEDYPDIRIKKNDIFEEDKDAKGDDNNALALTAVNKIKKSKSKKKTVVKKNQQKSRRNSKKEIILPPESIVEEFGEDRWGEVTCFCNTAWEGRPMIQCEVCATWLHMECLRLKAAPPNFVCAGCRRTRILIPRSRKSSGNSGYSSYSGDDFPMAVPVTDRKDVLLPELPAALPLAAPVLPADLPAPAPILPKATAPLKKPRAKPKTTQRRPKTNKKSETKPPSKPIRKNSIASVTSENSTKRSGRGKNKQKVDDLQQIELEPQLASNDEDQRELTAASGTAARKTRRNSKASNSSENKNNGLLVKDLAAIKVKKEPEDYSHDDAVEQTVEQPVAITNGKAKNQQRNSAASTSGKVTKKRNTRQASNLYTTDVVDSDFDIKRFWDQFAKKKGRRSSGASSSSAVSNAGYKKANNKRASVKLEVFDFIGDNEHEQPKTTTKKRNRSAKSTSSGKSESSRPKKNNQAHKVKTELNSDDIDSDLAAIGNGKVKAELLESENPVASCSTSSAKVPPLKIIKQHKGKDPKHVSYAVKNQNETIQPQTSTPNNNKESGSPDKKPEFNLSKYQQPFSVNVERCPLIDKMIDLDETSVMLKSPRKLRRRSSAASVKSISSVKSDSGITTGRKRKQSKSVGSKRSKPRRRMTIEYGGSTPMMPILEDQRLLLKGTTTEDNNSSDLDYYAPLAKKSKSCEQPSWCGSSVWLAMADNLYTHPVY